MIIHLNNIYIWHVDKSREFAFVSRILYDQHFDRIIIMRVYTDVLELKWNEI
jgi:hypothetical protein